MIAGFQGEHRWLSNFWPCSVVAEDGTCFTSVEQAYQWSKFHPDSDNPKVQEARQAMLAAATPGAAKRQARRYANQQRSDWLQIRLKVMLALLRQKFFAGGELAAKLLATGDEELVEANSWHDDFWGVCSCSKCGNCGHNHLGRLLMQVRSELRQA